MGAALSLASRATFAGTADAADHGRPDAAFDTGRYRQALGAFATGVTVMTARAPDGTLAGVTCNSFNSLSLSPPLVLWSLRKDSRSLQSFLDAGHFAVNVLAHDQEAISRTFASREADRFAQVAYRPGQAGAPLIEGTISRFECRLRQHLDGGDHVLFIGEVLAFEHQARAALVFHNGAYAVCGLNAVA